jgi:SAM-dependent methyltransferase
MNERLIRAWREALLLPGETDPVESGLRELGEYFGIGRDEARRACETALEASKREWESAARQTPAQIAAFYRGTRSYLFEHIWWHATDARVNAANVAILEYARRRGAQDYLDFGSGVGANAILFARDGFRVTLADISETMLDFARWRLARRGLADVEFINLNRQRLPRRRFDFVTAVDVCEHLARPDAEFRRISRAMKPGAVFVFNHRPGFDADRPMHILPSPRPLRRAMRRNGLRDAGTEAGCLRELEFTVLQRAARSVRASVENLAFGLYDFARYRDP